MAFLEGLKSRADADLEIGVPRGGPGVALGVAEDVASSGPHSIHCVVGESHALV